MNKAKRHLIFKLKVGLHERYGHPEDRGQYWVRMGNVRRIWQHAGIDTVGGRRAGPWGSRYPGKAVASLSVENQCLIRNAYRSIKNSRLLVSCLYSIQSCTAWRVTQQVSALAELLGDRIGALVTLWRQTSKPGAGEIQLTCALSVHQFVTCQKVWWGRPIDQTQDTQVKYSYCIKPSCEILLN